MRHHYSRGRFVASLGALGVPLAASTSTPARAADTYTMRMGLSEVFESNFGKAATRFAQSVQRRSNGQIKVEIYPSFSLAKAQEAVDGMVSGAIDLVLQASAYLAPLVPQLQGLDMPFLFSDANAAFRVLDGPIGNELAAQADAKGVNILCWSGAGFKELSTVNRAVTVPADMKGLRMRIQSGAVGVATYQALGAIPIVIDSSETFLALQNHTVDGVDFNLNIINTQKYYTLIHNVALMHMTFSTIILTGSKRKIDALPANLQKIVREEGKALRPYWRGLIAAQTAADIDFLKKGGVAFTEVQHPLFRKAVEPVYASFQSRLGSDFLDRLLRASGGR